MNFRALIECAVSEIPGPSHGAGKPGAMRLVELSGELGALIRCCVKMIAGKLVRQYFHPAQFPVIRKRIPIHTTSFDERLIRALPITVRSSAIPMPVSHLPGINGLPHIWHFFVVNVPCLIENATQSME